MIYGIDISAAQRGLSITTLKQRNPDLAFVAIKSSGSGGAYVNDCCDAWMQECFRLGLPCFNYDFTADGVLPPADPAAYADGCWNQITGYAGRAGFAFDWEDTVAGSNLMADADYAAGAVRRMQQHTPSPGFYIDYKTLTNGADWSKVAATGAWKWRASYVYGYQVFNGFGTPDWSMLAPTPAWPDAPAMWQYTSVGHLDGWGGNLDFNVFNGDQAALGRLLGITTTQERDMAITQDDANLIADTILGRKWASAPNAVLGELLNEYRQQHLDVQGWVNGVAPAVNSHTDAAVKGIALTLTDAQVQSLADRLKATLPAAQIAALAAQLQK